MTQKSFWWNGASVGDANTWTPGGGYHMAHADYESPWVDIVMRALLNGTGNRGVLANWLNELAVTGVATPVSVNTGAAIVYGLYYENDAALNVAVPSPSTDTRIDRIVVRRNWSDQEARITRIVGTEGGSAPAITQSPAPDGSGVYDIPLAQLSVTTGGVIAVTDEREFVTFCTAAVDGSIDTTQLTNESAGFAARAQVSKNLMFGGGDLWNFAGAKLSYDPDSYLDGTAASTWGAAAATMEGWQCTGTGAANDMVFAVAFKVPADHVPGTDITARAWFADDWAGATDCDVYSAWQIYAPATLDADGVYDTDTAVVYAGAQGSEDVILTSVLDTVWTVSLATISGASSTDMVNYAMRWYNAAGAESLLLLGIEFIYTGYV